METSVPHEELLAALRAAVPALDNEAYKGQQGKVGVMGGCREYTGAPYFAAMSAMRMGCDLAYVFCTPSAAQAIKCHSPELIVLPCLREAAAVEGEAHPEGPHADGDAGGGGATLQRPSQYFTDCQQQFASRLTAYVMGPGLGTDPHHLAHIEAALHTAEAHSLPVILDGSALNVIASRPSLVQGRANVLLTPNIAEFGRLAAAVGLDLPGGIGTHWQQHARELAAALKGPLLLSKGPVDIITDGRQQLVVMADGSPRRCGGQGDVLTGTIAAFVSWINVARKRQQQQQQQQPGAASGAGALPPLMLAAYGGCLTMRAAAVLGYRQMGRSLVAGDMIQHLGDPVLRHTGLVPASASAAADAAGAVGGTAAAAAAPPRL